jgi:serine/threonine-protein kinase
VIRCRHAATAAENRIVDRPRTAEKTNLGDQAAKARAAALIGTIISGRYRIVELIAMGGVGAVYLAEHVHMHKHVAVKVLHPDTQGLPDLVPRFEREAVAGAHIQHPNVAAATDFGKLDDGSCFLVLEYVRGTTLREVIRRGPLPASRAAGIARQIAAGLGAAHAMGILHRDVKPRNVMLIEGERDLVKLIDFGLAKLDLKKVSAVAASRDSSSDGARITSSGAVFGTIAYLAPEAALGMDTVDERADFYALGLLLYELLAGQHPFEVGDPVALFRQHHKVKPPPIATRTPGVVVPAPLEAVVMRLLEKAPEARYADAAAIMAALDAALEGAPLTPAPVLVSDARPIFAGPSLLPPPASNSGYPVSPSPPPVASAPSVAPPPPTSSPGASTAPAGSSAPPRKRSWAVPAATFGTVVLALAGWGASRLAIGRAPDAAPTASSHADFPVGPSTRSEQPTPSAEPSAPPRAALVAAASASAAPADAGAAVANGADAGASPPAAAVDAPPVDATRAPGGDAPAMRLLLRRSVEARDWIRATDAFFALVDRDSLAFHDPALVTTTRDYAANTGLAGGAVADRVFDALAHRTGADGVDILYEIVRTRGGSKAATRALDLLGKPEVLARATPALRITVTLRQAPCPDKAALLDQAAREGDLRTLVVMQTVAAACLGKSVALDDAEHALRVRLR